MLKVCCLKVYFSFISFSIIHIIYIYTYYSGLAYARYSSPQCAAYARDKLNGFEYPLGSPLHVQMADDSMNSMRYVFKARPQLKCSYNYSSDIAGGMFCLQFLVSMNYLATISKHAILLLNTKVLFT